MKKRNIIIIVVALLAVGGLWFYFFAGGKYLKGEEFKIVLNENNSAGYNWVYELSSNDIVSVEKKSEYKTEHIGGFVDG